MDGFIYQMDADDDDAMMSCCWATVLSDKQTDGTELSTMMIGDCDIIESIFRFFRLNCTKNIDARTFVHMILV